MPRRKGNFPREIFLSHSSVDRAFATRLARVIRDNEIRVWYSITNILGAQQWHDEIGDALARCYWFIVVLSPASVKSRWVKQELLYALNHHRYQNRIVPVIRRHCKWSQLSWTLDAIQRVDFTGGFDTGCEELLRIWGRRRAASGATSRRSAKHGPVRK